MVLAFSNAELRRPEPALGVRTKEGSAELLPIDGFLHQVRRERSRADRNEAPLCLAVLDLERVRWNGRPAAEAVALMIARLRITDVVGWFAPRSVGFLLPDTEAEDAFHLIGELDRLLERSQGQWPWRVYGHPDRDSGRALHRSERSSGDVTTRSNGSAGGRRSGRRPDSSGAHRANGNGNGSGWNGTASAHAELQRGGTTGGPRTGIGPAPVDPLNRLLLQPRSPLTRLLDVAGAALALFILSPVILAAAIAVKFSSPGPVIYRQQRCGLGGRRFTFYKFRSMYTNLEDRKRDLMRFNEQTGPVFKMTRDPRVTPVGRFLRRTSIDEIPQLWNVLKGDMSLVGPRPPLPEEVSQYEPWQLRRLEIPGGLTCIWQVSGRSHVQFEDWVRMDLRYARERSLWLDLALLLRTVPAVLTCHGAR